MRITATWCEQVARSRLRLHQPDAAQLAVLAHQREQLNELGWYQPAAAEYAVPGANGRYYGWLGIEAALLPGALRRDLVVEIRLDKEKGDSRVWVALVGAALVDLTSAPGAPLVTMGDLSTPTLAHACSLFLEVAKHEVATMRSRPLP